MPKSVRSTVAEALASTIDDTLQLTTLVGPNYCRSRLLCHHTITTRQHLWHLLKFYFSFPTWTVSSPAIPHVSNMSPTQSLLSLVNRKLSLGDVSAAIHVIASDDTILDVALEVLRALRLKHPGAPADADFPPFPSDINGFSASENNVAKYLGTLQ